MSKSFAQATRAPATPTINQGILTARARAPFEVLPSPISGNLILPFPPLLLDHQIAASPATKKGEIAIEAQKNHP